VRSVRRRGSADRRLPDGEPVTIRENLRSGLREAIGDRDAAGLSSLRRAIFYGLIPRHGSAGTRLFPS
jgi:hypothetical protein